MIWIWRDSFSEEDWVEVRMVEEIGVGIAEAILVVLVDDF